MAVITTLQARHDFKYTLRDWKKDVQESFQLAQNKTTEYTVVDGQVVRTVESLFEFASAIAAKSPQIPEPPTTFLYSDGTYRKESAYIFQKTHVITTTYEAYGEGAYLVEIEDFEVLTGKITRKTSIIDGKIPLAPTVGSGLTHFIQQPIVGILEDVCDFETSTQHIQNVWIETLGQLADVARRAMQRATAIIRRVRLGANPLIKIGQTVQLIDAKRGLDARHVITRRQITYNENGGADMALEMEFWPR